MNRSDKNHTPNAFPSHGEVADQREVDGETE